MNVLMISTEAYPFSKPSGLADVVHGLTRAMCIEAEQDVRVMMPLYRGMLKSDEMKQVVDMLEVPMGYYSRFANLWKTENPFPTYLLQHEFYFERDALYGYLDDYERFIFFTRAAFEILRSPQFLQQEGGWVPDIIHGYNGLTGLLPYWLAHDSFFSNTRFILTIHNMDATSIYGARALLVSEQAEAGIYPDLGESRQQVNFLGRGLCFADGIGMVNPHYEPKHNPLPRPLEKLEHILQANLKTGKLCAIRNGIDLQTYNPDKDLALGQPFANFAYRSLELRIQNKLTLQKQVGLAVDADRPLLGIVSRLNTSHGYGQLESLKTSLFDHGDMQLVVLGQPEDRHYLDMFDDWESSWKAHGNSQPWLKVYYDFDENLARQIYASCDMLLIPALELPSSTQQYIGMHYGIIPIVHRTGALYNSVEPYRSDLDLRAQRGKGVGIGFAYEGDGDQLLSAVQDALNLYRNDRKRWRDLQRHNMSEDFSWTEPSEKYLDLYQAALKTERQDIPSGKVRPYDTWVEGNERLHQAVREIDRLPGMRGRDIRYMLKHTARLIRWVFESLSTSADVYVWVSQEYLQPENSEEILTAAELQSSVGGSLYSSGNSHKTMQVVSSLWRDASGRHLVAKRSVEMQAEHLLDTLASNSWPSANDWLPDDELPLGELCQSLPDLHIHPIAQTKGWNSGWTALIASHSRVMGRIDLLFPSRLNDNDMDWVMDALSTLSSTFGLRLETVRFAIEKDQAIDLVASLLNAQSLSEVLAGLHNIVQKLAGVKRVWVYLLENGTLQPAPGVPVNLALAGQLYAEEALAREDAVYVGDWLSNLRHSTPPPGAEQTRLRALIAAPLVNRTGQQSTPVGVLVMASDKAAAFSPDQQRWLSKLLAPQAAAVLGTFLGLEQRDRKRVERFNELEAGRVHQLHNLADSLVIGGDFDQLLKAIVTTTAAELKARTASIYLYEKARDRLFLEAAAGYHEELEDREKVKEQPNYMLGEGVTGYIATQTEILRANSLKELQSRVPSYKGKYLHIGKQQHEPNAFLGIPLYIKQRDGGHQIIGVMKVEDRDSSVEPQFSRQDELLAQMMGNVIATVVHNIQVSRSQLNTLSDNLGTLSKVLVGASDMDTLLQQTVQTIANLVGAKASSLYLVDESTNQLVIQAASGYQEVLLKQSIRPSYAKGQGVTGWIWQEGKEFKADNYAELRTHPAWRGKQDELQLQTPTSFLGLPLTVTDRYTQHPRVIGVLKIEDVKITASHPEDYFTAQDVLLVKMMANVIATVVYNTQFSRSQLNTLRDNLDRLSQVLAGGREMDILLDQGVKTIADLVGAKASSLYLVDESTNQLVIQAASGYQEVLLKQSTRPSYLPGQGVTGWIWQEGKEFKADNYAELRTHPAWRGKQDELQLQTPTSFLGLPLTVTDRYTQHPRVIGVLKIEDIKITASHPEDYFTAQDVLLVKMMANVIATVVYNAQLSRSQLEELLRNISTLTNALAAGSSMEMLVNQVVETTARVLNAEAASLYLVDRATGQLVIQAGSGYQKSLHVQDKRAAYSRGEGVTGWIWQEGKSFKANDYAELRAHPAWRGKQDALQGQTPSSFLGLPLKVNEQTPNEEVIGVLKVEDVQRTVKHPEAYFTDQDVLLVTMMAKVIGSVIETARNGEKRVGELLKGIDPQLLFDASARSLLQSFWLSQEEGMIDQLAITLASQLDSHPELLMDWAKALFEAEANPLLYYRVAVHTQQPDVRQKLHLLHQAFSQSRSYLNWLDANDTLQPWLRLWIMSTSQEDFSIATGDLVRLLGNNAGLQFRAVVNDENSNWVGVVTETNQIQQPLIHKLSPRILLAFLREGPLDLLAWRQLIDFGKREGEFQITVFVDWRQQMNGQVESELRRDTDLRRFDVILPSIRELIQVQREVGALVLLRALISRQLTYSSLFILDGPVPGEMFFGRKENISRLLTHLKTSDFALVGNRQIGKTSLMKMVMARLEATDWALPLWSDCQGVKSAQQYLDKFSLTGVELIEKSLEGLESALAKLKSQMQRQPVLFIDELDLLVDDDPAGGADLIQKFRGIAQSHICHFVFGGSKQLAAQLEDANLRLYNFAERVVVGLLSPDEGHEALTEPLKAMDIILENPPTTIPQILDLTSCHPNLIQQAGHWLSQRALERGNRVITESDVRALSMDSTFAGICLVRLWGVSDPLERLITLVAFKEKRENGFTETEMESWLVNINMVIDPVVLQSALKALTVYSMLRREQKHYFFAPSGFARLLQTFEDVDRQIRIYLEKMKQQAEGER